MKADNRTSSTFGLGNFITLDGAMYRFFGNGEYYLFVAENNSVEVQARMVTCYSSSSCINAIAVNIQGTVVLIHARFKTTGQPVVLINGIETQSLKVMLGPEENQVVFSRRSYLRYRIENNHGLRLDVRLYDRYMDLKMRLENKTSCLRSRGLWGNCNGDSFDDLTSKTEDAVDSLNVSQYYIHEVYAPSWKVPLENSLFMYDVNRYREQRDLKGGGYALVLNNTGVQTKEIYSFSASDITIEFLVKLEKDGGTIISYATLETFAMVLIRGKVYLQYSNTAFDTLISLDIGKYYQVALVWSSKFKIVQIYIIDNNGGVRSRNFPINTDTNVFEPGGVLALGYWAPSPTGRRGPHPSTGFVGEIDELCIWNMKLPSYVIPSNWKRNLGCKRISGLANLWKFNEGQGNVAHDCISGVDMFIQYPIFQPISWVYSSVDIPLFSYDTRTVYSTRFEECLALKDAERHCENIILKSIITKSLVFQNTSTLSFFYLTCLHVVTRTNELSSAYWIALSVSDLYSTNSRWSAKTLCKDVNRNNFPEWVGANCDTSCQFGVRDSLNNTRCQCQHGFFGENCSMECPGGYARPCNGFSNSCDRITGECKCPATANQSTDCTKCKLDWTFRDCSVATSKSSNSSGKPFCQGFGSGYYSTFDGVYYNFRTYGEYYILDTPEISVQVRQIPCSNESFCLSSIAVKTKGKSLTIRAPFTESQAPLLWISGHRTFATSGDLGAGYNFRKTLPDTYEVSNTVSSRKHNSLKVIFWGRYLSFELVVDQNLCFKDSGLCSSCDRDMTNDFSTKDGTVLWGQNATQAIVTERQRKRWEVSPVDSLFMYNSTSYHEQREITASGYCLAFDGTTAFTNNAVRLPDSDFTLQVI